MSHSSPTHLPLRSVERVSKRRIRDGEKTVKRWRTSGGRANLYTILASEFPLHKCHNGRKSEKKRTKLPMKRQKEMPKGRKGECARILYASLLRNRRLTHPISRYGDGMERFFGTNHSSFVLFLHISALSDHQIRFFSLYLHAIYT